MSGAQKILPHPYRRMTPNSSYIWCEDKFTQRARDRGGQTHEPSVAATANSRVATAVATAEYTAVPPLLSKDSISS